ncbi:hypothetical protein BTO05_11325 [Winogradskyella sp. PC-19]|uniref:tetratricopeptide repeat-containing sensor histidine kinase n=1 Tax=unclassified Winogradskyella TaxID=2615021 RepID=UPI000B3C9B8D|nr:MULTISPECIES: tetratricopeptide repeat-containing sensor histidine kinase [unclassified Winogradskyella]ARV10198.1 hypothetical protein BTO05_11325 [Winogradskyella sp. PC-19]RZN82100.1 MAG: sensor histidine kinase [Winogradskyella sp.]
MSANFSLVLFLLYIPLLSFAQNGNCTRQDLIKSFSKSEKLLEVDEFITKGKNEEAFKIIRDINSKQNFDQSLSGILFFLEAQIHNNNGSFNKSLEAYNKILNKESTNKDLLFYTYLGIGASYMSGLREFEEVIPNYKKAEALLDSNSCKIKKALVYEALGTVNLLKENLKDSESYYLKALNIYLKERNVLSTARTYNNLGNLYFEHDFDQKAKVYFLKALESFPIKDSTNIHLREKFNYNLFAVNEYLGNYKKAIAYLEKSNSLRDSILNRDKVWEIAEYDKKLAISEKQKELTILGAENKAKEAQRNAVFISAAVLLLLLGVSMYYYIQKVKTNKIISSQNETLDNLNATKDKLFSIVSHDLRSSVNALKSNNKTLINSLQTKNLEKLDGLLASNSSIVNGAYNLLDNLLNWAMLQTKQTYFLIEPHRLHHLVGQVVFNYEALLKEKEITFKNQVSKNAKVLIDKESFKIILRNFLDNAIKFTQKNGEISILSSLDDDYWQVIIEDNGLGMRADKKAELLSDSKLLSKKENEGIIGTGLGMHLCKSYIKKNKGKFDIETQFGIGTKIIVSLPKADVDG